MKKRRIILVNAVLIVFMVSVIVSINKINKTSNTIVIDNVTYALNVNGATASEFPARGDYRVSVTCSNAKASWDYVNWQLDIENVRGNVSCRINFTSTTNQAFSAYIKSLVGTTQGDGEFVDEAATALVPIYSDAVALSESDYGTPTTYSSANDAFETSGTDVTPSSVLSFADSKWTVNRNNQKTWTFYHYQFSVNEDAYYQVCYEFGGASANNRLWIYSGASSILESLNAKSGVSQSDCLGVGYVTTDSYIKVAQAVIGSSASARPTLSFSIKKVPEGSTTSKSVDADFRYEGRNPNNYVKFNDELWRVIGVFDSNSHGQTGEDLVKIIRASTVNAYTFHTSASNTWSSSGIKSILNQTYYNRGESNSACYGYATSSTNMVETKCDFSGIGLSDYYKTMIANVSWYWGGAGNSAVSAVEMYEAERSSSKSPVTASVGLMYASDYGFAVLKSDCSRNTSLNLYNTPACVSNNWLSGFNWTMSTNSSNSAYAFESDYNGALVSANVTTGANIKPVVYLNSNVHYIAGSGTARNPYIIGI